MEWIDVLRRIAAGEDDRTEFKRSVDRDRVGPAIAALANSEGGLVVLGVDDSGTIVGIARPSEDVAEELTNFLQNGLSSPVQARLGRYQHPDGWVHWIEVARQRGYEPIRHGNRVYVRRARSSVQPSPIELQELYNVFGYILTEERAIHGTTAGDIDEQVFADFLRRQGIDIDAEPRLPLERDLIARGVMSELGPQEVRSTLYGWLCFGRRPQGAPQTASFFVECCAYEGVDRGTRVLQVAECKGRLDEQVERAVGWLAGLARQEIYDGVDRRDVHRVPEVAAREAIVNAVAHRDYAIVGSKILVEAFSDRVSVSSPGTLPNHMTPESVTRGAHPRSRNELVANFLLVRGLMEARGRGWPSMVRATREAHRPPPLLEQDRDAGFVRVTFPDATPDP